MAILLLAVMFAVSAQAAAVRTFSEITCTGLLIFAGLYFRETAGIDTRDTRYNTHFPTGSRDANFAGCDAEIST
jgi:hypothetical protein